MHEYMIFISANDMHIYSDHISDICPGKETERNHTFCFLAYAGYRRCDFMLEITRRAAPVAARIRGVGGRERIRGKVHLYHTYGGMVIVAELYRISQDIEEDTDGKFGCGIRDSSGGTGSYVVLPSFLYRNGVGWNSCYAGN